MSNDASQKLEYFRGKPRMGHSWFGVASICMAIAVWIFIFGVCWLEAYNIDPFDSMGNMKQGRISTCSAILGIFLAMRALADQDRKTVLGTVGLILNAITLMAAWLLLPCL